MRPCFAFSAVAGAIPVLSIYEDIGFWGTQAKDFLADLAKVEGPKLRVEINSPGGDVFAATAMYNGLRASGKSIETVCMGVAASAASLVFMAGDDRVMPKNTHLMVHNPWTVALGNADELRETAGVLDKIGNSIQATYTARSGMKDDEVKALLSKDTWLTADECKANGFATEVTEEIKATAKFDMARADLPANVKAVFMSAGAPAPAPAATPAPAPAATPAPSPAPANVQDESPLADQVMALAKSAGLEAVAGDLALGCATMADATTRISAGREIMALCKVANKADMAPDLIRANKTVPEARAALVTARAKDDETSHTNGTRKTPAPNARTGDTPTTDDIWAAHRAADSRNQQPTRK